VRVNFGRQSPRRSGRNGLVELRLKAEPIRGAGPSLLLLYTGMCTKACKEAEVALAIPENCGRRLPNEPRRTDMVAPPDTDKLSGSRCLSEKAGGYQAECTRHVPARRATSGEHDARPPARGQLTCLRAHVWNNSVYCFCALWICHLPVRANENTDQGGPELFDRQPKKRVRRLRTEGGSA